MVSLSMRGVWFSYDGSSYVLRNASLDATGGEVVAITGPTGSGKTTTLLILAGLLKPERGEVLLDGSPVEDRPEIRRRIGILFQDPDDQLFNPRVYDEIAYALRTLGMSEREVADRVNLVSRDLGLSSLLDRPVHKLSVGQKRLVALASILVYEPDVLLLDEPTANLDHRGVGYIRDLILRYRDSGRVVVVATHDFDLLLTSADRICLMRGGGLECGWYEDVLESGVLGETGLPLPSYLERVVEKEGWEGLARLARELRSPGNPV